MADWIRWVNAKLPHQIGADPDDGQGIDCLVMTAKVRRAAGRGSAPLPNGTDRALTTHWGHALHGAHLTTA